MYEHGSADGRFSYKTLNHIVMNYIRGIYPVILFLALISVVPACNTSKAVKGGAIGAAAGATAGGLIADNTAAGAIIGAAVGGAAGALIGRYMDKQAEEIEEEVEGAEVERVGEGILVTFDSGLLFGFDSYKLTPTTKENLNELINTIREYERTNLLIAGHTDSKGAEEYNMTLSRNRANSVSTYLIEKGVNPGRISTVGYGETKPVASNETESGRAQNRRVEVAIYANEELKEAAKEGALKGE